MVTWTQDWHLYVEGSWTMMVYIQPCFCIAVLGKGSCLTAIKIESNDGVENLDTFVMIEHSRSIRESLILTR